MRAKEIQWWVSACERERPLLTLNRHSFLREFRVRNLQAVIIQEKKKTKLNFKTSILVTALLSLTSSAFFDNIYLLFFSIPFFFFLPCTIYYKVATCFDTPSCYPVQYIHLVCLS
ncbi:hypothetical protein F5Y11DRAFT_15608 [Daldinia sp. FL1419]|nr:hypothetical protein F5Y11DRAFT_15608 [Daldinia sp. FL1419]